MINRENYDKPGTHMIHPYFIQMTIFQNFTVNILADQWTKRYAKFPDKAKSEPWLTLKHVYHSPVQQK